MRKTVSGIVLAWMDIPFHVWCMQGVMRRDFNEHHLKQVIMTKKQIGEMQMTEEMAQHVGTWEWTTPILLTLDMWLNQSTISLGGGDGISRKPHHKRWRWGLPENNDTSSSTTTTTTPSSSAFYREPPEFLWYTTALWLKFFLNNFFLMFTSFFVINRFLQFHYFNYENRRKIQGESLKNN